jgi:hypothetical protein
MITRKRSGRSAAVTVLPLLLLLPMSAAGDDQDEGAEKVKARLSGFQEVPTLSSTGTATFRAKIADDEKSFDWVLTYSGLTDVAQAHIHFGARAINGGIVIFLCTNLGNAPPGTTSGTQACPSSAGTVRGTATPADVGPGGAPQGIPAGDFAKVVEAIRAGAAYANVHTALRPGGEVRGQITNEDHAHHH